MENNIVLGTIQQPRVCPCCCSDANYEIYPRYGQKTIPKYSITTKGTQCSYCCCADCSCAEGETLFNIFSNALRIYSGNILKRSFNRDRKDYLFYELLPYFPWNKFEKYEDVLLNEFLLSLL